MVIFLDYETAENIIRSLISEKRDIDILKEVVDFLYNNFEKYSWIGIYVVNGDDLILGPWNGKQATEHTRIPIGHGICGSAASRGETEIVSDVHSDPRYLSCFVTTKSEIVVPIFKNEEVIGEIDIDSDIVDAFDEKDALFLERIADILSEYI